MEKVFALCRRTLLNRNSNDWSTWHTLNIYRYSKVADEECLHLRKVAQDNFDDSVDYCVVSFNVIG